MLLTQPSTSDNGLSRSETLLAFTKDHQITSSINIYYYQHVYSRACSLFFNLYVCMVCLAFHIYKCVTGGPLCLPPSPPRLWSSQQGESERRRQRQQRRPHGSRPREEMDKGNQPQLSWGSGPDTSPRGGRFNPPLLLLLQEHCCGSDTEPWRACVLPLRREAVRDGQAGGGTCQLCQTVTWKYIFNELIQFGNTDILQIQWRYIVVINGYLKTFES